MSVPMDDLDHVMAVMASAFDPAFGEAWTRRQVSDALMLGHCHYELIDSSGRRAGPEAAAAGFSLSRCGFEEEELLLLAVDPLWRRRGLGRQLLTQLIDAAKSRGARRLLLEMRRGNPAEALYRESGFAPIGERRNYYTSASGERFDAITFGRSLD